MVFFFRNKILALDQLAILQSETKKERRKYASLLGLLDLSWKLRHTEKIIHVCVRTLT